MIRAPRRTVVLLSLSLLFAPASALATWSNDVAVNTPVVTGPFSVFAPVILADGAGGVFIAWTDGRAGGLNADVYGQHFDALGRPQWTPGGIPLASGPSYQLLGSLLSDGAGGLIVAYTDVPDILVPTGADIHAVRVDAAGGLVWGPVVVCGQPGLQVTPTMASDGQGGAIVAWLDERDGVDSDIYARRVKSDGSVDWAAAGVAVRVAPGDVQTLHVTADGFGGAYVAWEDPRTGTADIYLDHLGAAGNLRHGGSGLAVCTNPAVQSGLAVAPDGQGGLLLAWSDLRSGNLDVWGQRVTAAGPQWPADGEDVISFTGGQAGPTVVHDGDGGMIVAWTDSRAAILQVRAQRLSRFGYPMWTADGVVLGQNGAQVPRGVPDGAGGMIAVFDDFRDPSASLFAQRVNGGGLVQWTAGGVPVTRAPDNQYYPVVASDGRGGVIAVWEDYREDGSSQDLYAQRVEAFGFAGVPEPVIENALDVPNDQGGRVRLAWHGSWPEMPPSNAIDYYNVFRSVPAGLAALRRASGARVERAGGRCESGDCLLATPAGAQTLFWEYVGSQDAFDLPGYSYVVATTSDSVAGSNPYTKFLVQARSNSGPQFWNSPPDSGYSTDDLAPAAPSPFEGLYSGGSVLLQWGPNDEPDLAGYRLHRGIGTGFVPSEANLVAALTGTGFEDTPGTPHVYKLAAIDAHGNLSPYTTLLPEGTVDAGAARLPREIALEPVAPNPAAGALTIRFALPATTRLRLAVFDAQGRAVRVVADGAWPAGEHAPRWDGRTASGEDAPAGVYLARLEAGGRVWTRRFVRMR